MEIRKILLVDDEIDIRKVAKLSLERIGKFEVVLAESGAEGIEKARSEKPDLIILDMMMPDMDGLTTFDNLKNDEETKAIPIIFMTAKAQELEKQQYFERGAIGVITKPFDPMGLPGEITKIVNVM